MSSGLITSFTMFSTSKSGYDANIFVDKPSEKYDCPICFNVLRDPRQCSNGHLFCFECIMDALRANKACPICKIGLNCDLLSKNLFVQNKIDGRISFCKSRELIHNSSEVCEWNGPLHSREFHFQSDCRLFSFKCPNEGCDLLFKRCEMNDHNLLCDFTMRFCEFCQETTQYNRKNLVSHLLTCKAKPIACVNDCGAFLPIAEHENHRKHICFKEVIHCPLFKVGACKSECPQRATRDIIMKHALNPINLLDLVCKLHADVKQLKANECIQMNDQNLTQNNQLLTEKVTEIETFHSKYRGEQNEKLNDIYIIVNRLTTTQENIANAQNVLVKQNTIFASAMIQRFPDIFGGNSDMVADLKCLLSITQPTVEMHHDFVTDVADISNNSSGNNNNSNDNSSNTNNNAIGDNCNSINNAVDDDSNSNNDINTSVLLPDTENNENNTTQLTARQKKNKKARENRKKQNDMNTIANTSTDTIKSTSLLNLTILQVSLAKIRTIITESRYTTNDTTEFINKTAHYFDIGSHLKLAIYLEEIFCDTKHGILCLDNQSVNVVESYVDFAQRLIDEYDHEFVDTIREIAEMYHPKLNILINSLQLRRGYSITEKQYNTMREIVIKVSGAGYEECNGEYKHSEIVNQIGFFFRTKVVKSDPDRRMIIFRDPNSKTWYIGTMPSTITFNDLFGDMKDENASKLVIMYYYNNIFDEDFMVPKGPNMFRAYNDKYLPAPVLNY